MVTVRNESRIRLGRQGPADVVPLGLGCMGMSPIYGASDEAESITTIHAALDAGINLIDTGDLMVRATTRDCTVAR